MTFKPVTWYPIAIVLSVANVIGVGFATGALHSMTHATLAVAFGLWAQRLGARRELAGRLLSPLLDLAAPVLYCASSDVWPSDRAGWVRRAAADTHRSGQLSQDCCRLE